MLQSRLYHLLYFLLKMHLWMAVPEFPVQTLLRRILLLPRLMLLILQPE